MVQVIVARTVDRGDVDGYGIESYALLLTDKVRKRAWLEKFQ